MIICTIKLLKRKSNAPEMVKEYVAFVERQLGSSLTAIQTDNGTEYMNNNLKSWLAKQGIILCLTAPYSPQQNGVAKHCNCTLADLIRVMLIEQCLLKVLWGTAVLHAAYLHN